MSITSQADETEAQHVNQYFIPDDGDFDEYNDILSQSDGALELEVLFGSGDTEFLLFDLFR